MSSNQSMKTWQVLLGGIFVGALIMLLTVSFVLTTNSTTKDTPLSAQSSDEPLYWVAPMDANYRRDGPGKSPMGMDLVPVYADDIEGDSPGTVKIDPVVVNNIGVKTTQIVDRPKTQTIKAFGKVHYAQDRVLHVHPRIEGWVERLYARTVGEYIEKGAPLYALYSPELVNAQEELIIALNQNNRNLIRAAKSRLAALEMPNKLIEQVVKDKQVLREVTFFAQQSGFVTELKIQEGFFVKPIDTMLAISPLEKVWVIADVFAKHASKIEVGQPATIESDYLAGDIITSQVEYIYPNLAPQKNTLQVRFLLDNPDFILKPQMFVNVAIQTGNNMDVSTNTALMVLKDAVIQTGEQDRVVLALGEGKFKSVEVQLGNYFDEYLEVLDGLLEGDRVVSSAQFLLDSESSIHSDFKRMEAPENNDGMQVPSMQMDTEDNDETLSAWTNAVINDLMADERMLNLSHGPLDAFNMMGMTMNFMVADSIDMSTLQAGASLHIHVIRNDSGMFEVIELHVLDEAVDVDMNHEMGDHS